MMLDVVTWLIAIPPLLAVAVFTLETLLGLRNLRQSSTADLDPRHIRAAVLVPAHNEEFSIGRTVQNLISALPPSWRLLVVADNCDDTTAAVAEAAGAETIQRHEPNKRGKGFALAFGRNHLALDPPDVVIVVDADCAINQRSLLHLAAGAQSFQSPVQATNLLTAPADAPPLVQISNFAMLVKNLVRARGLYRVAGGIPLFGTGMAFPWQIFGTVSLETAEVVEDLKLSLDLAQSGTRVHLIEEARVLSPAAAAQDTIGQRRRWEHGFLQTARSQAIPMLARGIAHRSRHQIGLGLHLCVPPLALLLVAAGLSFLVVCVLGVVTDTWAPAILLLIALGAASAATLIAWVKEGRDTLSTAALARAPLYVIRKLPIYGGFFRSRQEGWNRTRRRGERVP